MTPDKYFTESPIEVRSLEDGTRYVFGYAALYNVRSNVLRTAKGQPFVEVILPGAFDGCDMSAVRCQFEHSEFLAAAPTLEVGTDNRGLWYRYKHDPEDPSHVQMLRRINRRDCRGSSFMFPVLQPDQEEVKMEAGMTIRSIRFFPTLIDVSPVISPAYPETSVFARSLDAQYNPEQPEAGFDLPEATGSEAEAAGTEPEATGTTLEATGSEAEEIRNLNGIEPEVAGSQPEASGSDAEDTGSTSEPDRSETEEKRSIIARRKAQIDQIRSNNKHLQ